MELREFLSEYYELFADLETNKAQFGEEFYSSARNLLLKQFEQATSTWLDEQELAFAESRFELRFKVANYTPRRRFVFWWNRKAKALLRMYRAELERYLAELGKGTRDVKADKAALDDLPGQTALVDPTKLPVPSTQTDEHSVVSTKTS